MIHDKNLAIVGFGGHAKVVADIAQSLGWSITGFDDAYENFSKEEPWVVAGNISDLKSRVHCFDGVVIGIGNNMTRLDLQNQFVISGAKLISLIHPKSSVSKYSSISNGSVVMAGAIVNFGVHIEDGCIVNTGATVDHECYLSAGVHIAPGANLAGGVVVGERTLIGIGAVILPGIKIGKNSIVGAGSVVLKNVPDDAVVVGAPARLININS
jgi:sugar O-acyltransferase (sialic acid O-acetyltransferase NeuD family)